jgi:2-dehydropantoate 2-reductase
MPPSIAIFGAGSIGLYLASQFSAAGIKVTLVTRPKKFLPSPLIVEDQEGGRSQCKILQRPADRPELHDIVIVTVKAHQLATALPQINAWLGPQGELVLAQNGLPWWYFQGLAGEHGGRVLRAADPDGKLLAGIDLLRTSVCVVYKSAEHPEPERIVAFSTPGDRFILGRPLGGVDAGLQKSISALRLAGLPATSSDNVRVDLWDKLLGNVVLNPLSALTGKDLPALLRDTDTQARIKSGMLEAQTVAEAYGIRLGRSIEERLERTKAVASRGGFKTSMLQDREAKKPLEFEPIIGTVIELARHKAVPTPTLDRLYTEVRAISLQFFDHKEYQHEQSETA